MGGHKGEVLVTSVGGGEHAPNLHSIPVVCITTEEISWINHSQGILKVFS
jgi:hypothetical protein